MSTETPSALFWLADAVASFAAQVALLLILIALAAAAMKAPRLALVLVVVAIPFAWLVAQAAMRDATVAACQLNTARLRVATINLLETNRDGEALEAFVEAADPDVIATQETSEWWARRLNQLSRAYPFRARSQGGEIQILSKRPFRRTGDEVAPSLARSTTVEIDVGARSVAIAAVQLRGAASVTDAGVRRRQMAAIAAAAGSGTPLVVMGDFSASPTSLDLRTMIDGSPLRAPTLQWPPAASWPSVVPVLGLQVDHVLATEPLQFERVVAGPHVGSNHLPVVADLALGDARACRG